jgi:hypothetical protein
MPAHPPSDPPGNFGTQTIAMPIEFVKFLDREDFSGGLDGVIRGEAWAVSDAGGGVAEGWGFGIGSGVIPVGDGTVAVRTGGGARSLLAAGGAAATMIAGLELVTTGSEGFFTEGPG